MNFLKFSVVFTLLATPLVNAQTIKGEVVGVADGDTITVLVNGHDQYKIRLAQIDAPEKSQPWGQNSKKALSDLVFRKTVEVEFDTKDRYGRVVGTVSVNGLNVNSKAVSEGNAWVYRQYLKDQSLLALEADAKTKKLGLWSLPESQRMPPWEWRHGGSAAQVLAPAPAQSAAGVATAATTQACEGKRYCNQMTSCAEAQHYLNDCGVSSLDRDRDGVPCESLCR